MPGYLLGGATVEGPRRLRGLGFRVIVTGPRGNAEDHGITMTTGLWWPNPAFYQVSFDELQLETLNPKPLHVKGLPAWSLFENIVAYFRGLHESGTKKAGKLHAPEASV